jgi:hypothetical protein
MQRPALQAALSSRPYVLRNGWHVALWAHDDDLVAQANKNFDRFAGPGRDTISAAAVRTDITRLDAAAEVVKRYTDSAIAHARDEETQVPTFEEINAAIDVIGELVKKYFSLLQAVWLPELVPVIQESMCVVGDRHRVTATRVLPM